LNEASLASPARTRATRSEKLISAILNSIASGLNIKQACIANGVSHDAFLDWRKEDPALVERFEAARELGRQEMLGVIKAAASKDWRAAESHLRLSHAEYRTGNGPSVHVNTAIQNQTITVGPEKRKELQERLQRLQGQSAVLTLPDKENAL